MSQIKSIFDEHQFSNELDGSALDRVIVIQCNTGFTPISLFVHELSDKYNQVTFLKIHADLPVLILFSKI